MSNPPACLIWGRRRELGLPGHDRAHDRRASHRTSTTRTFGYQLRDVSTRMFWSRVRKVISAATRFALAANPAGLDMTTIDAIFADQVLAQPY